MNFVYIFTVFAYPYIVSEATKLTITYSLMYIYVQVIVIGNIYSYYFQSYLSNPGRGQISIRF